MSVEYSVLLVFNVSFHVLSLNCWLGGHWPNAGPILCFTLLSTDIARQAHVDAYPHLQEVKMIDLPLDEVSVLLGTDLVQAFTPMDIRKPPSDGVVALRCPFGWALMGKDEQKNNSDWAAFASFQDQHRDRPSYQPQ